MNDRIPAEAVDAACDVTYGGIQLTAAHARHILAAADPFQNRLPSPDREAAIAGILETFGQGDRDRASRVVDAVLGLAAATKTDS